MAYRDQKKIWSSMIFSLERGGRRKKTGAARVCDEGGDGSFLWKRRDECVYFFSFGSIVMPKLMGYLLKEKLL